MCEVVYSARDRTVYIGGHIGRRVCWSYVLKNTVNKCSYVCVGSLTVIPQSENAYLDGRPGDGGGGRRCWKGAIDRFGVTYKSRISSDLVPLHDWDISLGEGRSFVSSLPKRCYILLTSLVFTNFLNGNLEMCGFHPQEGRANGGCSD